MVLVKTVMKLENDDNNELTNDDDNRDIDDDDHLQGFPSQ